MLKKKKCLIDVRQDAFTLHYNEGQSEVELINLLQLIFGRNLGRRAQLRRPSMAAAKEIQILLILHENVTVVAAASPQHRYGILISNRCTRQHHRNQRNYRPRVPLSPPP